MYTFDATIDWMPMPEYRRTALLVGCLFLVTHVTSVTARVLYGPVIADPAAVDPASDTGMLVGAMLEVVLALAVVGTAIALYPVARRVSRTVALGYVALRTLEGGVILSGVVSTLALVSIRGQIAAGEHGLAPLAHALLDLQEWAFVVGPGFVCGTNTVLMAYLVWKSGFVPRFIGVLGLIGGPLVFAVNVIKVTGLEGQLMPWIGVCVVPVFAWEICLAVYLLVKGFRPITQRRSLDRA